MGFSVHMLSLARFFDILKGGGKKGPARFYSNGTTTAITLFQQSPNRLAPLNCISRYCYFRVCWHQKRLMNQYQVLYCTDGNIYLLTRTYFCLRQESTVLAQHTIYSAVQAGSAAVLFLSSRTFLLGTDRDKMTSFVTQLKVAFLIREEISETQG